MKTDEIRSATRINLYFLLAAFLLMLFFFYRSGLVKVIMMTLAYFIIIHLPGLVLMNALRSYEISNSFLAPAAGVINLGLFAFLFGSFGIHIKLSLIISLGLPYAILIFKVIKSGILHEAKVSSG